MFREKKGLEFFKNVSRVAARLMSVGRVFHRQGAAELKALSPIRSRILGGVTAPLPRPHLSALRFAFPCLARGLRPLHRPSLCVVDILRYFRPWRIYDPTTVSQH